MIILLGFFLGVRHALDLDHLVAVGTIVSRQTTTRSALRIGLLWGIGHSLTMMTAGCAIVLLGLGVPPRIGAMLELAVAAMLVILGAINLRNMRREPHIHDHAPGAHPGLRPVIIGVVHGLAGSAAVALLLVPTIRTFWLALLYLAVFGGGTIAGMMVMAAVLATPMFAVHRGVPSLQRIVIAGVGAISIAVGLLMAYEIAVTMPPAAADASVRHSVCMGVQRS
jgi:high-affinity nickel-transport protein